MSKLFTTVALALALSVTALSPAVAQTGDQPGPVRGMMGGGCPMMGMMGQGMGPGMMGGWDGVGWISLQSCRHPKARNGFRN